MITAQDIKVYPLIRDQMGKKELYIGVSSFPFRYRQLVYNATCTETVPLSQQEKVICDLLLIDECLYIEEMAEILGLEVTDKAEVELLTQCINSLSSGDYSEMLTTGDRYMSRCRLTAIGREYAGRSHKFKTTTDRKFKVFLDETTHLNTSAKAHYEHTDGKPIYHDYYYTPESDELEAIIAVQVPEIHNPKQGNSYINPVLQEDHCAEILFPVVIIANAENGDINMISIDQKAERIQQELTEWLNNNTNDTDHLLEPFWGQSNENKPTSDQLVEPLEWLLFPDQLIDKNQPVTVFMALSTSEEEVIREVVKSWNRSVHPDSRFFFLFHQNIESEMATLNRFLEEVSETRNFYAVTSQHTLDYLSIETVNSGHYYHPVRISCGDLGKMMLIKRPLDNYSVEKNGLIMQAISDRFIIPLSNAISERLDLSLTVNFNTKTLQDLRDLKFKAESLISGDHEQLLAPVMEIIDRYIEDVKLGRSARKPQKRRRSKR